MIFTFSTISHKTDRVKQKGQKNRFSFFRKKSSVYTTDMFFIILNLILAAVPSLLLLLYFYKKDRTNPEPPKLIWKTFGFGLVSVIPAFSIELIADRILVGRAGVFAYFIEAFIIAALVEELIKFGTVKLYVFNKPEFDEVTDGIVYTVAASLGFAMLENLMYSFGPTTVLLIRGVTAVPLHAIASGIMGYFIGLSKMRRGRSAAPGIILAVLIHGFYNFFLFIGTYTAILVIPLLVISWRVLRSLIRRAQLFDGAST